MGGGWGPERHPGELRLCLLSWIVCVLHEKRMKALASNEFALAMMVEREDELLEDDMFILVG